MTIAQFLAIPDDGVARELIRGRVVERGDAIHGHRHALAMSNIAYALATWSEDRGRVVCGECGFVLGRDATSIVGIDVAFVARDQATIEFGRDSFHEGPPILAVEILEDEESIDNIADKMDLYHEFGMIVWIADPKRRTIGVHRPGALPETFNERQQLDADPYLPGFCVAVSRFFE